MKYSSRRRRSNLTVSSLFSGLVIVLALELVRAVPPAFAAEEAPAFIPDLATLLETTIERTPKKISDSAAAISVLTQDDIRRSGATSIPELLRLVPGLNVARVDAHTWAISARGFNDVFANKLLVMMDGRSIYTPLFSGVFWDAQDTMMEDIERIEVVRGPGATLWGANAVNGVINIVTRKAADSQGLLVSTGAGTEERGFGAVRYGGKLSDHAYFKIYGKYFDRDESATAAGADAGDSWNMGRGGFRLDWDPAEANSFTLQGDLYSGRIAQDFTIPEPAPPFARVLSDRFHIGGGNILGRWKHWFSEEAELQLNAYYDRTTRNSPVLQEERDTVDVDLQHEFRIGQRQKIIWGAGFRRTGDNVGNSTSVSLTPSRRTTDLYSAFFQDEISVCATNLVLTLGSKFEQNDFTGFEVQPAARLLWKFQDRQTLWVSVSRAVRTPSRAEDDITINPPGAPPGFASVQGSRNFDSEKLVAFELGYRIQPVASLSFDLTGFYNVYDDLRTIDPTGLFLQTRAANNLKGETYGGEASATWQVHPQWRLQAGYSFLEMQLHLKSGSGDKASEAAEGASPQHQFFLRSGVDFGPSQAYGQRAFEFDSTLRYVSDLPAQNIPGYLTLDLRLAWHPDPRWEVAVVGQNLFDDRHPEFYPTSISTQRTEIERSVYAKLTWRF